jgi:hypothetical protein
VFPIKVSVFANSVLVGLAHHYKGGAAISPREAYRLADALTKAADAINGYENQHLAKHDE